MSCPKCAIKPGYHNWIIFAKIGQANLFYTAPAKTEDYNEDGTKLANIKIHVEKCAAQQPWIWVLDCANMEFKHYTEISFNIGLLNLLSSDKYLQAVWVIRPNMWIRALHSLFRSFSSAAILSNVSYFEGSNLELFNGLESTGLEQGAIKWLIAQ
jgi:hypothetical protein